MSNAPDVSDPGVTGNLWDSQITNPDAGTPTDGTPGADPQGTTPAATVQAPAPGTGTDGQANPQAQPNGQQPTEDPRDMTIRRLNGQIAAMQKQVNKMQRTQQPANPNNAPGGQPGGEPSVYTPEQFTFALNAVEGQVRRGLENRLALYDGSNPSYKDQGNLTPDEVMLVRSNPLAFCQMETVMSGDIDAVLDEIETRLAQITSTRAATGKQPGAPVNTPPAGQQPQGIQVNPSPTQTPDTANNPQGGNTDYWSMPLDQLRKVVAQNRQATQQTR